MRLIDGDDLLTAFPYDDEEPTLTISCVRMTIKHMPTIDAEPIRHGHWILDKRGNYACEFCGNTPYHSNMYNMNYCSNCGAKLTIERDNITTHLIWNGQTNDQ